MSTKSLQNLLMISMLCFGLSISAQAQSLPEMGSLGIRANIGGQSSIEMPYMMNETLSLAPYLGFNTVEDNNTRFNLGVRPRYYNGLFDAVSTYFTGVLGLTNTSYANTDNSVTNFTIGGGYGAEYFISDRFTVSADANLNAGFGDGANTFGTNVRVSASIYF